MSSFGQEICNNGIDDDGDNLIDCYDPDCCGNTACEDHYFIPDDANCVPNCQVPSPPFNFGIQLAWQSAPSFNGFETPIIGDLDLDPSNGSEILVSRFQMNGGLNTLSGQTGTLLNPLVGSSAPNLNRGHFSAIGNLDTDPNIEIVSAFKANGTLECFDYNPISHTLTPQWTATSAQSTQGTYYHPSIADFNHDGTPEVYNGLDFFNGPTGTKYTLLGGNNGQGLKAPTFQVNEQMISTIAADVFPGGNLELVAGNTVYEVLINTVTNEVTLTPVSTCNTFDGRTAIADYDNDGDLDGFVTGIDGGGNAFFYIWDLQTGNIIGFYQPSNGFVMSLAAIGDIDGDGEVEVVLNNNNDLVILEDFTTATLPFMIPTTTLAITQSNETAPTLFDFDGDGAKEIIIRDGNGTMGNLTILDYQNSILTTLKQVNFFGPTAVEVSVVIADVDNDNEAEIVTMSGGANNARVAVFESAPGTSPWRPCRNLWNQYNYFGGNINDDLSIPTHQQRNAYLNNSNSLNYFLGQHSDTLNPAPDAIVSVLDVRCSGAGIEVDVEVCNQGDADLPMGTPISIYENNPTAASLTAVATAATSQDLSPNSCETITINISTLNTGANYHVAVNDDGSVQPLIFPVTSTAECNYANNIVSFAPPTTSVAITANPGLDICSGESTTLTATGTNLNAYAWMPNGETTASIIASTGGIYSVVATANNNCTVTANVTVNELPLPQSTINITPATACAGEQITLDAQNTAGTAPFSFAWNWPNNTATTQSINDNPLFSTTYNVEVTDDNGCVGSASETFDPENCCFAADNPDYLQITTTNAANLSNWGTFNGTDFILTPDEYHTFPDKVYIENGITIWLEANNGLTTLDLTNADLVFGTCAGIRVADTDSRILAHNSVLRPCDPFRSWNGIRYSNGDDANQVFQECTFINANVGLDFTNNVVILEASINNNLFSNCQVGIRMPFGINSEFTGDISGNTFTIDDKVGDIVYNELEQDFVTCNFIQTTNANPLTFTGIIGTRDVKRPIAQNDFINNMDFDVSNAEFHGIVSQQSGNITISSNYFSNMHVSVNLSSSGGNGILIENNFIEQTNYFNGKNHQIAVAGNGNLALISGNTIIDSREKEAGFTGDESAIFIDGTGLKTVKDNYIRGFETGIFSDNARSIVVNNEIFSHYYGVYQNGFMNVNGDIGNIYACNLIEMDLEFTENVPAVGIEYDIEEAGNNNNLNAARSNITASNCIRNTTHAIRIINNDPDLISNNTYMDPPPLLYNNYLYNYTEAGLSIQDFEGSIGNFFDGTSSTIPSRNSFVSNMDNGVTGWSDILLINTLTGTPTLTISQSSGHIENNVSGTGVIQTQGIDVPSMATCGNQIAAEDAPSFNQTIVTSPGNIVYNGCDDFDGFDPSINTIMAMPNDDGFTIANDLDEQLNHYTTNEEGSVNALNQALNFLSQPSDLETFYNKVVQKQLLTGNHLKWFTYRYYQKLGEEQLAMQTLNSISAQTHDEQDLIDLESIQNKLDNGIALSNQEQIMLVQIDEARGAHAAIARGILHQQKGNRPYIFPTIPAPKRSNVEAGNKMSLDQDYLEVYPNPSSTEINIEFNVLDAEQENLIRIFDLQGRLVKEQNSSARATVLTVDVQDLAQGAYVVTLSNGNGVVASQKFIKQ